ncbi:MAG: hypothetical protein ACM3KR_07170 [Deltaproteobacteria bacterium]
MDTEQLLIPISIKAMAVGALPPKGKNFANRAYIYSSLDESPLGNKLEPNMLSSHDYEDQGVHLHWILPDIMKQGKQDEDDKGGEIVQYPSVPNRWYITRLWTINSDSNAAVHAVSWLVESDALQGECGEDNNNANSPMIPTLEDSEQQYRFLGRSYPASKTAAVCTEYLEQLTAVAPGLPAFSAYYPDCRNVFGFYDSLLDEDGKMLENADITYVVCGWYETQSEDILKDINSVEKCAENLKWKVPENLNFPAVSLCHGTIYGINWTNNKKNYSRTIPDPELAVGNTTAEALAALAEWKKPSGLTTERMLNLFYSGNGALLNEKNGLLISENRLHEDRFGKEVPITQVAFKEKETSEKQAGHNDLHQNASDDYEMLNKINSDYISLFNKNGELQDMQEEVYDLWYKYMFIEQDPFAPVDKNKLQQSLVEQINNLDKEIIEKRKQVKELASNIDSDIEALSKKPESNSRPIKKNGQAFWMPNEPVLLLSGIQRDRVHGEDGRYSNDGNLFCRNTAQLIDSLTIDKLDGIFSTPNTVYANNILDMADIPKKIAPFVAEALIITPSFAPKLAMYMLDSLQCKTDKNMEMLTDVIKKLQSAPLNPTLNNLMERTALSGASGFNGVFPERNAVSYWIQPWIPLFIEWSARFYYDTDVLMSEPSLNNWNLNESSADYAYKKELPQSDQFTVIEGRSILAPNGASITASCASRYLNNDSLVDEALDMDVLSQALNGTNRFFVMKKADIKLPVNLVNAKNKELRDKVFELIKDYEPEISNFDNFFSPVRAGFLRFSEIRIIDSFGQLKILAPEGMAAAENMRSSASVFQKNIMLTPRLIQPSRLNFCWLNPNCDAPQGEDNHESPICGWFLPNHTDCSVMVYDGSGNLLGSMQRVKLEKPVVWKNPPEKGGGTAPLPKDMNPTLYKIISPLLEISESKKVDMLTPFLNLIDSALWSINPTAAQQYNSLGQYIGRPLIIVNANLQLEQSGIQNKYKQFMKSKSDPPDVKKAEFSIHVGRRNNHNDGLIGFFCNDDYGKFQILSDESFVDSPEESEKMHEEEIDYFVKDNTVTLTIGDAYPTKLTMIMDFAASVDFISGILPIKTVKVEDQIVNEGLNKLYFTIFSAPVLGDISEFSVPCPKLDGKQWKWLRYSQSTGDDIPLASNQAYFPKAPFCAEEGWLQLKLNEDTK